jgi:predicted MPP superfamily phosphohydrolase
VRITRRRFLAVLAGGGLLAGGSAAYAVAVEPTWLRTVEVDIPIPRLDPAFDGYTIAQLSDLHVGGGASEDYLRSAAARATAAGPDLVALTGDYVQGPRASESANVVERVVGDLSAPDGVLAVFGNHDAGVYDPSRHHPDPDRLDRVADALRRGGARVLVNESVEVRRGEARLRLVGLGDLWIGDYAPACVVEAGEDAPRIALTHNPDTALGLARLGCDLILCGHTHGGQVSIPFFGPPLLPVEHRELAAGLCRVGKTPVYVNRGVGWLRRIRFGVRPEVTVIRLRAGA